MYAVVLFRGGWCLFSLRRWACVLFRGANAAVLFVDIMSCCMTQLWSIVACGMCCGEEVFCLDVLFSRADVLFRKWQGVLCDRWRSVVYTGTQGLLFSKSPPGCS